MRSSWSVYSLPRSEPSGAKVGELGEQRREQLGLGWGEKYFSSRVCPKTNLEHESVKYIVFCLRGRVFLLLMVLGGDTVLMSRKLW